MIIQEKVLPQNVQVDHQDLQNLGSLVDLDDRNTPSEKSFFSEEKYCIDHFIATADEFL